ncbi:MAG TPA: hypothetical protein VMW47_00705 [Verrucomicrobiae bacterium]|nr:hypothetical protein [Verrucomicrobiae bacterium]
MRARHLPLVLLGAAVLSACATAPPGPVGSTGRATRRPPAARIAARPAPARPTTRAAPASPARAGPPPPVIPAAPRVSAAYRTACAAAGGAIATTTGSEWAPGICTVTYPGEGTFPATLDGNGGFDVVWAQRNQTDCGLLAYYAGLDAAGHHPWRQPPLYHPASGACFAGQQR